MISDIDIADGAVGEDIVDCEDVPDGPLRKPAGKGKVAEETISDDSDSISEDTDSDSSSLDSISLAYSKSKETDKKKLIIIEIEENKKILVEVR